MPAYEMLKNKPAARFWAWYADFQFFSNFNNFTFDFLYNLTT